VNLFVLLKLLVIIYFLSKRIFVNERTKFTPANESVFEEIIQKTTNTIKRISNINIDRPLL